MLVPSSMQSHAVVCGTRMPHRRAGAIAVSAMLIALAGCEREGIGEHTVDKGVERVPGASASDGGADQRGDESASGRAEIGVWPWVVPEGWTEDRQPRQMRLTTYIAPDPAGPVEVAVTRFAGRVGGDLANVNRWRGQMGLPPLGKDELESAIGRFSAPGFEGYEARIESARGVMLAAGVYQEAIDQMWFIRSTVGEAAIADRLEANVFGMARSIADLGE